MRQYGQDILTIADELTDAYVEIFTAPPWSHRDPDETRVAFRKRLESDAYRPGFRALIATSDNGDIEGFATGWTTLPPFRTDRSYGEVIERLGLDRVNELLVNAFEVDELGVRASARGTGLGKRLVSDLAAAAPEGRAWLLAWSQAPDTLAFYRRIGWLEPEPLPGHETDIVVFVAPTAEN